MQQGIKVIDVKLTKIGVSSFSLNDSTVTFEVSFDDGIRKQVYRTATVEEPAELANSIVEGIITMEENINMEFDGQDLIGNTTVVLNNHEDARMLLAKYFEDIYVKFYHVKNAKVSDGYMDSIKRLQNSELRFNV